MMHESKGQRNGKAPSLHLQLERAAVLLGVIVHQNSNSTLAGTNGEANNNDANKLWKDTVSN